MKRTVKEVAEVVGAKLVGDGNVTLTGIASLQSAAAGDLSDFLYGSLHGTFLYAREQKRKAGLE
jgi:UDP-3-O-[3-hydroxymyristoyl] glucosamine N-acyltransferase